MKWNEIPKKEFIVMVLLPFLLLIGLIVAAATGRLS